MSPFTHPTIVENYKSRLKKMSRLDGRHEDAIRSPLSALKVLKIKQTSPLGEREDHEKYSGEASAAIKSSFEAIRGRGGFATILLNHHSMQLLESIAFAQNRKNAFSLAMVAHFHVIKCLTYIFSFPS